jgi:hypothetical protein
MQVVPAYWDMSAVLPEVQWDQLTFLAGQHEVPTEDLAMLGTEQDSSPTIQEMPPSGQDRLPVLQETPLQSKTSYQPCKTCDNSSWRWRRCRGRRRRCEDLPAGGERTSSLRRMPWPKQPSGGQQPGGCTGGNLRVRTVPAGEQCYSLHEVWRPEVWLSAVQK